jgi:hypothetical protein
VPSVQCPKCEHPVTYLDDLIGTLQCPDCGENILHGRDEPRWQEDALEPHRQRIDTPRGHTVELEADDENAEMRGVAEDEPLPGVSLEDRPGGIRFATNLWIGTGVLALVLNVPLLLILMVTQAGDARSPEGLSPLGVILFGIVLIVLAVVFYAAVIRAGRGFRRGAYRHVQLPAWVVLLLADVLLLVHTNLALQFLGANSNTPLQVATAGVGVILVALDILLILSSAVLLWQSGRYAHWARGAISRPVASADRSGFPRMVTLAGRVWLLIGLGMIGLTAALTFQAMSAAGLTGWPATVSATLAVTTGVAMLTPLLLALTLLTGRLSSTLVPGWIFLLLSLLLLAWCWRAWSLLTGDGVDFQRTVYLFGMILCGLGVAASLACMIADGAYRTWLRTARGLHV